MKQEMIEVAFKVEKLQRFAIDQEIINNEKKLAAPDLELMARVD